MSNNSKIQYKNRYKILCQEYTAFRNQILRYFVEEVLPSSRKIFDSMAGTAPLIPYVNYFNIEAYFNDINPLHFYINKAKTYSVYAKIKEIINNDKHILFKELHQQLKGLEKKSLVVSSKWMPDEILVEFKTAWENYSKNDDALSSFYQAIILLCIKPFSSVFRSEKNLLWLKPGGMTTHRSLKEILINNIEKYLLFYKYYYSDESINNVGRCILSIQNAFSIKLKERVDTVITSPPFPNRYDFSVSYGPELYFLSEVGCGPSMNILKNSNIATNVVKNYQSFNEDLKKVSKIAPATYEFLLAIKEKQKKRENNYYLRYYLNYYNNLFNVLDKTLNVLTDDGKLYIVVQNNIHRGELNNMGKFVAEFFMNKGYKVSRYINIARPHQGTRNISADYPLVVKKHLEVIIKVYK